MSTITINVMAPLVVGDPADPNNERCQSQWNEFDQHLQAVKVLGVDGVSTDVWWGLIEPSPGVFNWSYYDKLAAHIIKAGLKWVPILSFHQCGGNIGDNVYVPVPAWIWGHLAQKSGIADVQAFKYVSEQGNASNEYVSVWATDLALDRYEAVMREFQRHFAPLAANILEVNISLGPAGELRYPSYNSHDQGSGYPTRGALQCYSSLARASLKEYMLEKYGSEAKAAAAWGVRQWQGELIYPPGNVTDFFGRYDHVNTQFGRDFFDWYTDSLLSHGRKIMTLALQVFSSRGAAFKGIDLGAKVPGVHWRMGVNKNGHVMLSDRLAELTAGLIRTSLNDWTSDQDGRGYRPIVSLFKSLQSVRKGTRVVLHFTCLEMPDGGDRPDAFSLAHTLVVWMGEEARRQGVTIKGENALNWTLVNQSAWDNIRSVLAVPGVNGAYAGLTILRMGDCLASQGAYNGLVGTLALNQLKAAAS